MGKIKRGHDFAKTVAVLVLGLAAVAATAAVPAKEHLGNTIRIAAANSSEPVRKAADFRCTGSHDEKVLNAAIAELTKGGKIILGDGDYFIDGFEQEGNAAVLFGYNDGVARTITVTGTTENKGYNTRHGATFHVTMAAMDAMDPGKTYRVFFGAGRKPAAPGDSSPTRTSTTSTSRSSSSSSTTPRNSSSASTDVTSARCTST